MSSTKECDPPTDFTAADALNPDWKSAIEQAMHLTLMNKPPPSMDNAEEPRSAASSESSSLASSSVSKASFAPPRMKSTVRIPTPANSIESDLGSLTDSSVSTPPRKPGKSARRPTRPPKNEERKRRNDQVEHEEKLELLSRLQYFIQEKAFQPFRDLGAEDSIEDIRYEVFRATRDANKKKNVKIMQKGLVTVAAVLEMANKMYNPFKMRLDGYSKSLLMTIHDYDDIFEELHWKYCDSLSVPVELRLAFAIGSSMWVFHMGNHASPPPDPEQQPTMSGPRSRPSGVVFGGNQPSLQVNDVMNGIGMIQTLLQSGGSSGGMGFSF